MSGGLELWPVAASAHAQDVDRLALAFSALVAALSAPVFILFLVFALKYRRGREANRISSEKGEVWIEASWTSIPFVLALGFLAYASWSYFGLHRPPPDALTIDVVAQQWMWKVQHPGGQREIDELHVPAGQPVRLLMTSQDVVHSLYLPALRLKQDVLPGRYTSLWFSADRPGTYPLRCAEFCGFDHSVMGGKLVVMRPDDYARWLEKAGTDGSLAEQGFALFRRLGCSGCHEAQSTRRAPSLAGLYGAPVPLDSGQVVIADEQYLRDSILYPARDVAAGYAPIMPTFAGQVSEAELLQLTAYLKSIGGQTQGTGR